MYKNIGFRLKNPKIEARINSTIFNSNGETTRKRGSLHALTSCFDSRRTCKAREKQFQTVRQNDSCKAFFECVFRKQTIVAMRDINTVPLDRSFH